MEKRSISHTLTMHHQCHISSLLDVHASFCPWPGAGIHSGLLEACHSWLSAHSGDAAVDLEGLAVTGYLKSHLALLQGSCSWRLRLALPVDRLRLGLAPPRMLQSRRRTVYMPMLTMSGSNRTQTQRSGNGTFAPQDKPGWQGRQHCALPSQTT